MDQGEWTRENGAGRMDQGEWTREWNRGFQVRSDQYVDVGGRFKKTLIAPFLYQSKTT